ncbi:hypothetical protein P171DRAFT_21210 [Karstenula rhodostoma CBS 690.94]|uniref:Uncharacterized protein n=1 Tax=Karstenula rhodostoma CBS 690.94 TaxID=1392251 RepID=A0A9P4UKC0_9PLEO|nr:hypothetical protein P171DRAFT_21210 [Karstenula rhodostoma CBS 690.94]
MASAMSPAAQQRAQPLPLKPCCLAPSHACRLLNWPSQERPPPTRPHHRPTLARRPVSAPQLWDGTKGTTAARMGVAGCSPAPGAASRRLLNAPARHSRDRDHGSPATTWPIFFLSAGARNSPRSRQLRHGGRPQRGPRSPTTLAIAPLAPPMVYAPLTTCTPFGRQGSVPCPLLSADIHVQVRSRHASLDSLHSRPHTTTMHRDIRHATLSVQARNLEKLGS